jgi:hypothetical protein
LHKGVSMSFTRKLTNELRAFALVTAYFACWLGSMMLVKILILREYRIEYAGITMALVAAFVLAKVVLVMEHVPLGKWVSSQPAWVNVIVRTSIYSLGVFIAIVLEKSFEGRAEHGGFVPSMLAGFEQMNLYRTLANTICVAGAILMFNVLFVFRRHLGRGGMVRLFTSPLAEEHE